MPADPTQLTSRALDLLAHDLRNATSALWTGVGLLPGASEAEATEIGDDLRAPAGIVQVVCDLLVEAARAGADGSDPVELELSTLVRGAATRARRAGIELRAGGDEAVDVIVDPARTERLLCAAALELGGATGVVSVADGLLVVRSSGDGTSIPARVREAAGLLADAIGSGIGAWRVDAGEPEAAAFRLAGGNR